MAAKSKFYRDKRRARCMGVCAGVADYLGVKVGFVRLITIVASIFWFPVVPIAYCVIGFITDEKPPEFYDEPEAEQEFWRGVRQSTPATVKDVGQRYRGIDRRLRRVEAYVTSNSRRLDREIERLRDA